MVAAVTWNCLRTNQLAFSTSDHFVTRPFNFQCRIHSSAELYLLLGHSSVAGTYSVDGTYIQLNAVVKEESSKAFFFCCALSSLAADVAEQLGTDHTLKPL